MRWSKRLIFFLVAGFAALAVGLGDLLAVAASPMAWVARYNGPGSGVDAARAVAVDAPGNVYVTGESVGAGTGSDYATLKYDASGNELWVARYDGPGNGGDGAVALAVDPSGSVYVTGTSSGSDTGSDYATIKYDAGGNQVWVARYNGPDNGADTARALAVDAWGNVYVTGTSGTIKYDAAGNELWVARRSGVSATALAVDASGDVYVAGSGPGFRSDYATVKYDTNGDELWVAGYNGPSNGRDQAVALALDGSGNVYVTGSSEAPASPFSLIPDYATIKYDADGNQIWVQRYNNFSDTPSAIAVDLSGNVCVTGSTRGYRGGADYATIRYDADGNQLWLRRYAAPGDSTDQARALALDASGNVYVTGYSSGDYAAGYSNSYYATVKYDALGNQLWVARYDGPGNNQDVANAIASHVSGNVYVTGESIGPGTGKDYATIKYAGVANVRLSVTGQQRTDSGVQITLELQNGADAGATAVQLTGATLAEVEGAGLPQSLPDIPAGGSATATLTFAGDFAPGSEAILRVRGRFEGGSFAASRRVTLP